MSLRTFAVIVALAILVLFNRSLPLGAVEKADGKERKKQEKFEVKVHIHHKPAKFNLADPQDQKMFIEHAEHGEIDEIEIERNPMEFKYDLGLWTIVIFVALIFILRKMAWAPMVEGLQKREQSIRSAVDEAKLAREETEQLRAKFKTDMDAAYAEIPKLLAKARQDADKLTDEMRAKAAAEITADRDRLRREIALAHDQALQSLWDQTAQLATLISANVLARSLTPDDHQRMLTIAMEELKGSGQRFRQDIA